MVIRDGGGIGGGTEYENLVGFGVGGGEGAKRELPIGGSDGHFLFNFFEKKEKNNIQRTQNLKLNIGKKRGNLTEIFEEVLMFKGIGERLELALE